MDQITTEDLLKMIPAVFPSMESDRRLGILVDVPRDGASDNSHWQDRRQLAQDWYHKLKNHADKLSLEEISLLAYPDVGSNNADLPGEVFSIEGHLPPLADKLTASGTKFSFTDIFKNYQLFMAPTEYSTTAPLKIAAKSFGFRAATMPGFSRKMIPALRLDYNEVNRRVSTIKEKLDRAVWAKVDFLIDQKDDYKILFDLRFRSAHASSGRFPEKGTAGNFPSGESYIVPYEGEFEESSMTGGILPVQLGDHILLYVINENRAIDVQGYHDDKNASPLPAEQSKLREEPAYGNMAELGFGVLEDFGLAPINETLLDEKLGFHVAFGRSDHFGGVVGPANFSSAQEVVHLDRIYIEATQPRISVETIQLGYDNSQVEIILKKGKYLIF